ncbi:uncharacterized protein J4E84_010084 [Alternaria hordeiaustralica]|uniref:uncharacterized protein n=1 Tax=Alternaria hordeiaustralica TaxID=1187925 RepID=UPI0020C26BB2|nr:uncharacterized protein J4E84_010084 [Alternaria hordeiaustralica]KAI4675342.1 hypothetical protein J4E84_010084 [Alternaria hordeiaustralica]
MAPTTTPPSESERLRAKCHEALKGASETELEREALQVELQALRDRDRLMEAKVYADHDKADDAFLALAQMECLELCTKVHNAFPREIRDAIYSYITGDKDVYIACGDYPGRTWDCHSLASACCIAANVKAARWWKPEYMGAQMVQEIGENYYRSSHFIFESTIARIVPFRAIDHLDLGFAPVDFISNVEIKINCRNYKFKQIGREDSYIPADIHSRDADFESGWVTERHRESPKQLLVELELLFGFRHGTAITIDLLSKLCEDATLLEQQEWMAYTVVPVIFPILQRLKDVGCRARILLSAQKSMEVNSFASKWNPKSLEAITQDVQEYVKVVQDRLSKAELDKEVNVESDEDPDPSTASIWDATAFAGEEVTSDNADEA